MEYTISSAAQKTGIAPSAIRYYEEMGLLPPIRRHPNGKRYFTGEDMERLALVCCLKKTGLSLRDIQACFAYCDQGEETIEERIGMFLNHRAQIEEKMRELSECMNRIDERLGILYEKKRRAGLRG